LFILTPLFDLQPPVAYEFGYQIGSNAQPMELDVTQSDGQTWKTIFEFTDSGQVRVEFIGLRPGEPRPTAFTTGAILAEKVSNLTALPRNTRITNFVNEQNKGSQSEGKQNLGTMNRAQQAYYLENEKFASRLEELGVGINPETENYRYRIVPQGNQTRSVMMTAQAKNAGLKSYTGAVFVVKVKDEDLTLAEICETDEPSSTPPAMPSAPKNGTTEIQCPAGSHRAGQRR
jgi:type II secretory pathway pseudopilin PulG